MKSISNANKELELFKRKILSVAISLSLIPFPVFAGLKATDIKGLDQDVAATIRSIRSGKSANGDTAFVMETDSAILVQRLRANGSLDGDVSEISTEFIGTPGLAVNPDGSYVVSWVADRKILAAHSTSLDTSFTIDVISHDFTKARVDAFRQNAGFAVAVATDSASDSTLFAVDQNDQSKITATVASSSVIAMDPDGDFFVVTNDGDSLNVSKNGSDDVQIAASQVVKAYDFGSRSNPNKSITFEVSDPVIANNDSGDIVIAWKETTTQTTRKAHQTCYTYYGKKHCYTDGFTYSSVPSTKVVARRYDNDLKPKDATPLTITTAKGTGKYINDVVIVMDTDGDFTVGFSNEQRTYKTSKVKDDYGQSYNYPYTLYQSDIMVVNATNNSSGKLTVGKAVKVSSNPKLTNGHNVKNVRNVTPNIIVTNEKDNEFIIMWRNDYEDHYKQSVQVEACLQYKTYKSYGYSYKECVKYGYKTVQQDYSDNSSKLLAKRYSKK